MPDRRPEARRGGIEACVTRRTEALAARIAAGDRRALARAITLVEFEPRRPPRRGARRCSPRCPSRARPALRVGLTGTPGVGKSSFVESLGLMLTGGGRRLAVLAVDPVLGALGRLDPRRQDPDGAAGARSPRAFIRPSPSQAALGGVARRTRETIRLVEAWGAEVVLVETVGVGQSETMVAEMTDVFVLLIAPGGGDELQGVKRGIMEMADLILVNKADGEHLAEAGRTRADYAGALRLLRPRPGDPPGWPRALTVSALTGAGLARGLGGGRGARGGAAGERRLGRRRRGAGGGRVPPAGRAGAVALVRGGAHGRRWDELAAAVAEGRLAPDAAADAMLRRAERGRAMGRFFQNDLHDEFGSWRSATPPPAAPTSG